jgi:hypothetical protein
MVNILPTGPERSGGVDGRAVQDGGSWSIVDEAPVSSPSRRQRWLCLATFGLVVLSVGILGLSFGLSSAGEAQSAASASNSVNENYRSSIENATNDVSPPYPPQDSMMMNNVDEGYIVNTTEGHYSTVVDNDACQLATDLSKLLPSDDAVMSSSSSSSPTFSWVVSGTSRDGDWQKFKDDRPPECYTERSPSPGVWFKIIGPSIPTTSEPLVDGFNGHFVANFDRTTTFPEASVSVYEASQSADSNGSEGDRNDSASCESLVCVGSAIHILDGQFGTATWNSQPGKTYYLTVHRTAMMFTMNLTFWGGPYDTEGGSTQISAPSDGDNDDNEEKDNINDTCELARDVPIHGSVVIEHRTVGTGDRWDGPECYSNGGSPPPGVWYKVVAPTPDDNGGASNMNGQFIATFKEMWTWADSYVSVYEGDSCGSLRCALDSLHQFDGHLGSATWKSVPGRTYYIMVHQTDMMFALTVRYYNEDDVPSNINDGGFGAGSPDEEHYTPPFASNTLCRVADHVALSSGVVVGITAEPAHQQQQEQESDIVPNCSMEADGNGAFVGGGWGGGDGPLLSSSQRPGTWYKITPVDDMRILASFDARYTHSDTRISIFENDCGELYCVSGGEYDSSGRLGFASWWARANVEYKILVRGSRFGEFGLVLAKALE